MSQPPCQPDRLPISRVDWGSLVRLLGKTNRAVSAYNGVLQSIPNPAVLLTPLTVNEAVLSSRIEGTQATLQEVFGYEGGEEVEDEQKRNDIREIVNYRIAMNRAAQSLADRPLTLKTLQGAHFQLLDSVRGR